MTLDKRKIADLIEREYVNGSKSLRSLAKEVPCSQAYLSIIGRDLVPGYEEATKRRWSVISDKFVFLNPKANDV